MVQGIETLQSPTQERNAPQIPEEAVQQFGQALSSLSEEEIESLRDLADDLREMSEEELTALKQVIDFLVRRSDQYDAAVQTVIRQGLVEPGDLPPDFDPVFFDILSRMVDDAMSGTEPQQFYQGGIASLKKSKRRVAKSGRNGDTMLAHLSPKSAETLRSMGGAGTTNPETGLKEYFLGNLFKGIGSFFKKAAGVVLPIALNFAFPGLGTIASGAIGAGLGALINGATPGQALTAGLVGGAGGALFSGAQSMLSGGSFMQGVTGALPTGLQSLVSPATGLNQAAASASTGGAGSYSGPKGVVGPAAAQGGSQGFMQGASNWISQNPMLAVGGAGLAGLALASAMTPEEKQAKGIPERNVEPVRFAPDTFKVYEAPRVNVVPTYSPAYAAQGGEIDARYGGHLKGPGTGTSDSIPARLSDGEFVMTAAAVRGAGNGSREAGAKKMYNMMHKFEKRA